MGNFVNYMQTFAKDYNEANRAVTRKQISEWFMNKKAVKRNDYKDGNIHDKKNAVVVVGVSCIGKTTYVQRFLTQYPDFAVISYDGVSYQNMDEIKLGAPNTEFRLIEILEEHMLEAQDKNIIVDSVCINPASRAALMRFLAELGYEIHLIFFTQAYTEANIKQCIARRAFEQALFQDYLARNDTSKMSMRELMLLRNDILAICAKERGKTVEELKVQASSLPSTLSNIILLTKLYDDEIEENRVWWQEKRELFMLGADYYYEYER